MIKASELRTINADGKTIEQCPGCPAVLTSDPPSRFPWICMNCWLKGWRNQGQYAFEPGETPHTPKE